MTIITVKFHKFEWLISLVFFVKPKRRTKSLKDVAVIAL